MSQIVILTALTWLASCGSKETDPIEHDITPVKIGDKWGFVDLQGEYVVNPHFDAVSAFTEGRAIIEENGLLGFIGKDGEIAIAPQYAEATNFSDGMAWVILPDSAPKAIDHQGKVKFTATNVRNVSRFSDGVAIIQTVEGKNAVIDKEGKNLFVFPAEMTPESSYSEGLIPVYDENRKYGYADKQGKLVIGFQYESALDFHEGKAIVCLGGSYGVINKKGKFVINPQFENMAADGDRFAIINDGKIGWCDNKGKLIISPQFDNATLFMDSPIAAALIGTGKWGYVEYEEGKWEINPQFDEALPFYDDAQCAFVKKGEKWGLINQSGEYVANPQFDEVSYTISSFATSQFFDADGIAAWLLKLTDDNKVDGMKLSETTISQFLKKYGDVDFDGGEAQTLLTLNDETNCTLLVHGAFHTYAENNDYWMGNKQVYQPNATIDYATLVFHVSEEKHANKLYNALVKKFKGFKGQRPSKQYFQIEKSDYAIILHISESPITKPFVSFDMQEFDDTVAVDSTAAY